MKTRYQLIFLGHGDHLTPVIESTFFIKIKELGLPKDAFAIIDADNFSTEYKKNAPAYCLYFGSPNGDFMHLDLLDELIADARLILPVVADLKKFNNCIPPPLHPINGFEAPGLEQVDGLVGCILEGLSLLRASRRVFISYKRDESTGVAIQLFERLEKAGFNVFLDTHSIRPGEQFQDELWQRLADTDIVVLLNTPGFINSEWSKAELARANSMSIGILQLIWPTHKLEREAEICIPLQLTVSDFAKGRRNGHTGNSIMAFAKQLLRGSAMPLHLGAGGSLNAQTLDKVVGLAESLRARSLAARRDNLIKEFMAAAKKLRVVANLKWDKTITANHPAHGLVHIIPTVGVPEAFTYYNSSSAANPSVKYPVYLLYDQTGIRDKWVQHLGWLDKNLPVKSIQIKGAEQWLKNP
jgi:hypothetical protein